MSPEAGLPSNVAPGDPDPNLVSMGLHRTAGNSPANFDIPLPSAQSFFQNMTVTFAASSGGNGNPFTTVTLFYSTNGIGGPFTAGPSVTLTGSPQLVTLAVPVGANNAPNLVLRLQFTNGGPGNDLQTIIDNIQVNGTIIPQSTTIRGGATSR
jgi:hypothetical protein